MPLYEGLAERHSIVFEIGNAYTRCGFVHEYAPRAIIKSKVYCRNIKKMINLMDIIDRDQLTRALKEFIETIYFRYLAVNPKDRRVVVSESIFCSTLFRETLIHVLFCHFDVPGVLILPQHLIALSTLMINSGLILDAGYKETIAIPVVEGVTLLDSVQFAPLGGRAIHDAIMKELNECNAQITQNLIQVSLTDVGPGLSIPESVLEDIKVQTCFVAPFMRGQQLSKLKSQHDEGGDTEVTTKTEIGDSPKNVRIPINGDKILELPGIIRESVAEILFDTWGSEYSMVTLILDSILSCPIDLRKQLASNIVVIGGTSMLPGFHHRLLSELKHTVKHCPRYVGKFHFESFKMHPVICKENYVSWLGASIIGSTDAITLRSLSRDNYIKNNGVPDWCNWWPTEINHAVKPA